jgi:pilus assembly protein FimV
VIKHLRITVSALLAVAASVSPLSAWALGLGQMEVKSQRDEPLLAEIVVISNDPTELEALQARLASPDTFARVGLAPPSGIVSDLQFSVALDARGRPVIRVTSAAPVQQPLLTFLLEVDWGQGRLVREYSALIDTPQTAAAPVQPPIQEAVAGNQNLVVRPVAPAVADPAVADPVAANPLDASAPVAVPLPAPPATAANPLDAPSPQPIPLPPTEIPATAPAPVVATAPSVAPAAPLAMTGGDTRVVRRGETLTGIAAGLDSGYSLDQTIVALLRANPEAFIGGNINRVKAGAVLRIPDGPSIAGYSADEAALVMREQMAQWRGERRALPQPPAVVGAAPAEAAAPAAATASAAAQASREARLQIVPATASAAGRAATKSGISAGGKGDMLREQELLETKETLAARSAEVDELKARVAELEALQAQQQQLIALKDNELAAAQQRLATADQARDSDGDGPGFPRPRCRKCWLRAMARHRRWRVVGRLARGLLRASSRFGRCGRDTPALGHCPFGRRRTTRRCGRGDGRGYRQHRSGFQRERLRRFHAGRRFAFRIAARRVGGGTGLEPRRQTGDCARTVGLGAATESRFADLARPADRVLGRSRRGGRGLQSEPDSAGVGADRSGQGLPGHGRPRHRTGAAARSRGPGRPRGARRSGSSAARSGLSPANRPGRCVTPWASNTTAANFMAGSA